MTVNKIIITEDNIIGKFINKTNKFINLSSLQTGAVKALLLRIPNLAKNVEMLQIAGGTMFDSKTMRPKIVRKKNLILSYVVDSDDKKYNIKIANIGKIAKIVPINIIVLRSDFNKSMKKPKQAGTVVRIANYHHTKKVMDEINAKVLTVNLITNINKAVIVQTKDDRAGSIDGIKLLLNIRSIPFDIEKINIGYNEAWLTSKTNKYKLMLKDTSYANDKSPDNDATWAFKAGYCDYISTDKGTKRITIKKNDNKTPFDKINDFIKKVWVKLTSAFDYIMNWFKPTTKTTTTVASTLLPSIIIVSNSVASVIEANLPQNAKKDIKEANKIITKMQLNKMIAKSGISGNKEILAEKTSDSFNAYLASMTSYGATDAVAMANSLAASKYKTRKQILVAIITVVIIVFNMLTGQTIVLTASLTLIIMNYYLDFIKGGTLFLILNVLASTNLLMLLTTLAISIIETSIKDRKTATYRTVLYLIVTCLTLLI